jgi:hypothetical protein
MIGICVRCAPNSAKDMGSVPGKPEIGKVDSGSSVPKVPNQACSLVLLRAGIPLKRDQLPERPCISMVPFRESGYGEYVHDNVTLWFDSVPWRVITAMFGSLSLPRPAGTGQARSCARSSV